MAAEDVKEIQKSLDRIEKGLATFREYERGRDKQSADRDGQILAAVDALPDEPLNRRQVREVISRALTRHTAPTEETP